MNAQQRSNLVVGLLLLLVGGWFLAVQFSPQLADLIQVDYAWPVWVIGVGALFLVLSVIASAPGLAVPAAIIAGIGGLLYWQDLTGDYASWAYAWTLIPGCVGVGIFLSSVMEGRFMHGLREMANLVFFSLIMFGIFGSFLDVLKDDERAMKDRYGSQGLLVDVVAYPPRSTASWRASAGARSTAR